MKVLKLHPLMTVSLVQLQILKILQCGARIYRDRRPAQAFETLRDTGFVPGGLEEYPLDETLSIREFESELADKFHLELELLGRDHRACFQKHLKLYQLPGNSSPQDPPTIHPDSFGGEIPQNRPADNQEERR